MVERNGNSKLFWWYKLFCLKCQLQVLSQVKHEILQPQWFIENSVTRAYHAKFSRFSPFFRHAFHACEHRWAPNEILNDFLSGFCTRTRILGISRCGFSEDGESYSSHYFFVVFVLMPPCWSLLNKIKPFRISLL